MKLILKELLISEDGRFSKSAVIMFLSFIISSFVIIYQTLNNILSDVNFAAYLACWVTPSLAKTLKIKQKKEDKKDE